MHIHPQMVEQNEHAVDLEKLFFGEQHHFDPDTDCMMMDKRLVH